MDDLIRRQEAVEVADAVWCVTGDTNAAKIWDQIKNLPSAHCDNCPYPDQHVPQEDAVSRKELKHIFETWLTVKGYSDAERNIIKAALYELQFAPSVMPVQRSFSCGQENDLISRREAIDALDCINGVEEVLKALPPAQPEIIRCKDCKYRGVGDYCVYGTRLAWVTKSNDFCSKAERRTDEE